MVCKQEDSEESKEDSEKQCLFHLTRSLSVKCLLRCKTGGKRYSFRKVDGESIFCTPMFARHTLLLHLLKISLLGDTCTCMAFSQGLKGHIPEEN